MEMFPPDILRTIAIKLETRHRGVCMRAEIISIGTEIMLGEITDTNAAYIASQLPTFGIDLLWVSQLGDNPDRLRETFNRAWERSDIIFTTGGLGPTQDDLTREMVAGALNEEMYLDKEQEQHLREIMESRGRTMPENNLKQAGLNIKVINGSVSGSTSSGGLNRADWSLSEPGIDLIILGLGANDMLRGIQPEETERNLEQIITVAQNKKIKIILAGMVAPDTHGEKYKKEFDAIYPKLSKKYNLALIPFLLEGVALNPSLNQQDGIHPNKDGTIKVSETIKKSIINMIN